MAYRETTEVVQGTCGYMWLSALAVRLDIAKKEGYNLYPHHCDQLPDESWPCDKCPCVVEILNVIAI